MAKKPVVKKVKAAEKLPTPDDVSPEATVIEAAVETISEPETAQVSPPKTKSHASTKTLGVLTLLLVGGAAALYAGPKLAPMLPAGMATVANFLSPGEASATGKITALSDELNSRLSVLESAKSPDLTNELDTLSSELNGRITGLSDQIAAVDGDDIEARLTSVETTLAGLVASMNSLNARLDGVGTGDGSVDISGFQTIIDGLRAQIETLSSKQGMIGQRIDDVAANTDRRVEEAQTKVTQVEETAMATITDITRSKALSDISAALESGSGFSAALGILMDGGVPIADALNDVATGVPTLAALKSGFSGAAHAGLKASIKEKTPESITGKFAGFFKSQVTVRSLEPQEGDSTDAILSRIQGALDNDDLTQALAQAANLNDVTKSAMANWLSDAKTRQAAVDAVSTLLKN